MVYSMNVVGNVTALAWRIAVLTARARRANGPRKKANAFMLDDSRT